MSDTKQAIMPVLLVKPGTVSREDIKRAEEQGFLCIIECAEPEAARFLDAPLHAPLDAQARASIALMRAVLSSKESAFQRATLTKWYCDVLINEAPPSRPLHVLPAKA